MSDLTKAPREQHRVNGWPLLALLEKHQPKNPDERGVQHLAMVFQLYTLRALYGVIRADLGEHPRLLPLVMLKHGQGTEDGTTLWIGDHDPVGGGFGEMAIVYAKTSWLTTRGHEGGSIKIEAGWDQDDEGLGDPDYARQIKAAARWIVDHVTPEDFNTVATRFWEVIGVREPFTDFTPAQWFGIISGNPDYDRRPPSTSALPNGR